MAAVQQPPQPPGGVAGIRSGGLPASHLGISHKSFAAAISSSGFTSSAPHLNTLLQPTSSNSITEPTLGSHKGHPSITFDDNQLQVLSAPYGWSLIGKFAQGYNKSDPKLGRPSTEEIHTHLLHMDFKGSFTTGLMDNRHVWIRFSAEEDYLRLYSRPIWYIAGKAMRMFKWTLYFRVDIESSLVPVWVKFPRLPIQFFQKTALFPIASLIGMPLRLDAATDALKRPSVARVQIEIDLLKPRHDKIWINVGSGGGYWQTVEYEVVPDYCSQCMHVGHRQEKCSLNTKDLPLRAGKPTSDEGKWVVKPQPVPSNADTGSAPVNRNEPRFVSKPNLVAPAVVTEFPSNTEFFENRFPRPPVIFCADDSDEDIEEIVAESPPQNIATTSSSQKQDKGKTVVATSPNTCSYQDALQLNSPSVSRDFNLQDSAQILRPTVVRATQVSPNSGLPKGLDKTAQVISSPSGRTLPLSFQPTYNFNVFEDDASSWRTVNSGEEEAEDEDSGREDSMEEFIDIHYVRDDDYLDQRRYRQARRDRDILLMRRGRGRPLGSRNRTFSDDDHPMRQSTRSNKGIPPKHFEPSL